MLKFARNSLIVFDFEEALSFEGETGPYLQYTIVRLNSIFRKLFDRTGLGDADLKKLLEEDPAELNRLSPKEAHDFWDLILYAAGLEESVLHSIYSLEFSHLAKFSFNLCQKTNAYYHLYSILAESDPGLRKIRMQTILYVREILRTALSLMGIPQPERM